jgi:hypothetical protein
MSAGLATTKNDVPDESGNYKNLGGPAANMPRIEREIKIKRPQSSREAIKTYRCPA